uniref:Uncharacterized protein n=1 Tax=Lepeophtheirus salmonis TaxID=72036 RepID=A0A0K2VGC2_LEPSM
MPLSHDITTAVLGRPSRNSFLSERRPRLNSLNHFFTVLWDGVSSHTKI